MDPRKLAADAVNALVKLGLSQKEIALRVQCHECTISRTQTDPDWPISKDLAEALQKELEKVRQERVHSVIGRLPVTVLDACHKGGLIVDEKARLEIARTITETLARTCDRGPLPVNLPDGFSGALACFGAESEGLYLIAVDVKLSTTNRRRVLAHELEHLRQRLLAGIRRQTRDRVPESGL